MSALGTGGDALVVVTKLTFIRGGGLCGVSGFRYIGHAQQHRQFGSLGRIISVRHAEATHTVSIAYYFIEM
jgi:hypothetical protein